MSEKKRVRETSIEAFRTIEENGLLSKRRLQVYKLLFDHGPATGAQVARAYNAAFGRTSASETIRNRITELRDMGCVKEVGIVLDEQTGMKVTLWDVTRNLPTKFEKSKRHKCPTCKGKGFLEEQQAKFF